ncbi:ABC transporter substrate-binding protein [Streptomyces xiamenensis]
MKTTKSSRARRAVSAGVAAAVAMTALAACSPGGGEGDTFTILQYEGKSSAQYLAWQTAVEIFQEEHPDVKVEFTSTSFDSMQKNAKLQLTGNNVPDVVEINKGNADAGQLASQGIIDNLDEQVEQFGWDEKVTGAMTALARYDEEGKAGSGSWYGVPNIGEVVVFFYNKDMFAERGIDEPPATMADLEATMQTFLDEGITPVASGASGFGALWTWWGLVSADADRKLVDDYMFLRDDPSLDSGAFLSGTERFEQWVEKGYLGEQIAAVTGEQMNQAFLSGDSPMIVENSAAFSNLKLEGQFDWGAFLMPEASMVPGSSGHLWAVPAKADNKELAYDWIDITLRPEVQNVISQNNGLPLAGDPSTISDPQTQEINELFREVADGDRVSFFPDYPIPGFLDVQQSGMQSMVNGTMTAEELTAQLQEFYDRGKSQLG